jgi:hypothetical protein
MAKVRETHSHDQVVIYIRSTGWQWKWRETNEFEKNQEGTNVIQLYHGLRMTIWEEEMQG